MPIKSNLLKNIYIAKSLEELIQKADDTSHNIQCASNIKHLIRSTTKLYDEAKRSHQNGDEERSYILFYRFFQSIQSIKRSNEYKKEEKFFSELIGLNKLAEVVTTLETLSSSLQKRYYVLKESHELRAKEIADSNAKTINDININHNSNNDSIDLNESSYPLIDCQTLVDSLENSTEMTKILILDTRRAEEYSDSHIDKLKTTADLTIANVSENLLTPALTASKLEQVLPYGNTKDAFDRRRRMNKVVIVDKHSSELIVSTPAFHLAEALWRWDYTSLKVKSKPFLLRGGYDEWALTYPMFTSNPNYVSKANILSFNKKQFDLSFNYEFNDLEDEPKKADNYVVNGITNGDVSEESQTEVSDSEQSTRLNNIFHPRPTKTAIPGTALPLIPDRSTKPKAQNESNKTIEKPMEVNEDFEKIKLRKQNEINEEMMSIVRDEYIQSIESITKDLELKTEENSNLRTTIRKLLPEKPSIQASNQINDKPVIAINGDINSLDKRKGIYSKTDEKGDECNENTENSNDFHLRNSVSMNGDISDDTQIKPMSSAPKGIVRSANSLSVSSNLSRSLSSPNIAQLLAKEQNGRHFEERNEPKERSLTNPSQPQYDRALKPIFYFHDSSMIDNKLRDFCPVHSAGSSITGLRNLGNTCFMNAVIQCLLNTTEFSSFFSGKVHINKNSKFGSNGELVIELMALFRAMAYPSSYKSISAKDFKQVVGKHIQGFIGCAQQDSHEFLVKLLEKLHEDLNESTARDVIDTSVSDELSLSAAANKFWKEHQNKDKSIITKLFEGLMVNTLTCLTCYKTSNTFEVFSCLSLPLSSHRTTLNECLNQYFKPERMSGDTAWECPTCRTKREADKKVLVWKLPKYLIVHLKRFSYEGVWRQKLQTNVEFPIDDLMMRSLNSNETHYSLYGVVNHYGTLEGGHYTAYSQNPNKYKWHRFDDQEISSINAADVKTVAAYILFYKCW